MIPFHISAENIINQIEVDTRREGVPTLIFELLKAWKEIMGKEVNTKYIHSAFIDMALNSTAAEFTEFLRYRDLI